jgi:hypothetical protein
MYVTPKTYFYQEIIRVVKRLSSNELPILKQWDHAEIVWKVRLNGLRYNKMSQLTHLGRLLTSHETLIHKDSLLETGLKVMGEDFFNVHPKSCLSPNIPEGSSGWLTKPAKGFNGRGIHIFWDIKLLRHYLKNVKDFYVVQQYVHQPLLLDQRKFDIRLHVLITPEEILMHQCGYIKLAPQKFTQSGSSSKVHLTNIAINTTGQNLRPLSVLDIFGIEYKDLVDFVRSLKPLFKYAQKVEQEKRDQESVHFKTFELLGLDIMYDLELKPWLIEVNADPGVKSVGLYQKIAPKLIDDTLKKMVFNGPTEYFPL